MHRADYTSKSLNEWPLSFINEAIELSLMVAFSNWYCLAVCHWQIKLQGIDGIRVSDELRIRALGIS